MTEALFAGAAGLLARRVGLRLDPALRHRLERCVREGAAAHHLLLDQYVTGLESNQSLFQDLLNRVTVQETAFFRDPGQFRALAAHVLPSLNEPVLIWSAGCANGQEAYSLAITLAESGIQDWRVLATDVSTQALRRASEGRYTQREMTGISESHLHRYFEPAGAGWAVIPGLRQRIAFQHNNLMTDVPPFAPGACPVIFCRNVLIYVSPPELLAFLDRLIPWMPPSGYLFLGYSESLWQVTDRFRLVNLWDAFAYQRADVQPRKSLPPLAAKDQAPSRKSPPPLGGEGRVGAAAHEVATLLAAGEAAAGAGDASRAVTAFRKAAYLDPDHPLAHFQLGLALEAMGERKAARRAYAAARAAIARCDTARVEAALEGYRLAALEDVLDFKLQEAAA
jgi:chemotaxis protein methyltransferase CheR